MFENTLRIGETQHGLDFFYGRPQDSRKLLEFLQHISPVKYKTSQKLIGHDVNNATYNYKQTYHVELPTVCKDDLICLSKKQAGKGHVIIIIGDDSSLMKSSRMIIKVTQGKANWVIWDKFFCALELHQQYS